MNASLFPISAHGVVFYASDTAPEATAATVALVKHAKARTAKLEAKLENAVGVVKRGMIQHAYSSSFEVKLYTMLKVATGLGALGVRDVEEIKALAKDLKLHEPILEPVEVFLKSKAGGNYRLICAFGIQHKTAQQMVRRMLGGTWKPQAFQFGSGGRTTSEAVDEIRDATASGKIVGHHLDIRGFFDAFDHDALLGGFLPLPKKVIEHVVTGRHYQFKPQTKGTHTQHQHNTLTQHINRIRSAGIPQGSALSPTIAAYFVSKLKLDEFGPITLLNWVDDFLILAEDEETLKVAEKALSAVIAAMPAGNFKLVHKDDGMQNPGFGFLGLHFHLRNDGTISANVSPANANKISVKAARGIENLPHHWAHVEHPFITKSLETSAIQFARPLLSWVNAFRCADDISIHATEVSEYIELYCNLVGVDVLKVMKAAGASLLSEQDIIFSGG